MPDPMTVTEEELAKTLLSERQTFSSHRGDGHTPGQTGVANGRGTGAACLPHNHGPSRNVAGASRYRHQCGNSAVPQSTPAGPSPGQPRPRAPSQTSNNRSCSQVTLSYTSSTAGSGAGVRISCSYYNSKMLLSCKLL